MTRTLLAAALVIVSGQAMAFECHFPKAAQADFGGIATQAPLTYRLKQGGVVQYKGSVGTGLIGIVYTANQNGREWTYVTGRKRGKYWPATVRIDGHEFAGRCR